MTVRTRFAPSPTGYLHVGGLRTALYNFLFAQQNHGQLILRVEDTDQKRKVDGAIQKLIDALGWAGIIFDEGPHCGGENGPYIQSERISIYQKYIQQLLEEGHAYYCFCTEDDLQEMRETRSQQNEPSIYDGRCQQLSKEKITELLAQQQPYVIRLKIDRTQEFIVVHDLIRGEVHFPVAQIDDSILIKSDGFPTYHLANVIDDHLMQISHVIRGEEWLSSLPKHFLLYQYFGWEPPQFAHLPLLLNPDRSKLSKRQGDVAVEDYHRQGFLPECLNNFVALLGWNTSDNQEIFSLEALIQNFSLERIGKSGAVFDRQKLEWMNQQYIKAKTNDELLILLKPLIPSTIQTQYADQLPAIVHLFQDSLIHLNDITQKIKIFEQTLPPLSSELKAIVDHPDAQKIYQSFLTLLNTTTEFSAVTFAAMMKTLQKETGLKGKNLWSPIRIALTGEEHGPDLGQIVAIFGKDLCQQKIQTHCQ